MAKAGDRHEALTGNIWAYAHKGDITGVKAALARGADVDIANTVGWTACHAAAAGGHTKVIRLLVRAGADLTLPDRGGNLPVHEAARSGHVNALQVLVELGADITRVRLSQTKGQAMRALVSEALRKAGQAEREEDDPESGKPAVGYSRKQAKSNAFFGPRRTPISTKIKKKILKDKRSRRREKDADALSEQQSEQKCQAMETHELARADGPCSRDVSESEEGRHASDSIITGAVTATVTAATASVTEAALPPSPPLLGYAETVLQLKRNARSARKGRQQRRSRMLPRQGPGQGGECGTDPCCSEESDDGSESDTSSSEEKEFHRFGPWDCGACTYANPSLYMACDMCGTKKGPGDTHTTGRFGARASVSVSVSGDSGGSGGSGGSGSDSGGGSDSDSGGGGSDVGFGALAVSDSDSDEDSQ